MGEVLSALLVAGCLVAILLLMLPDLRRNRGYAAKTTRGLASYKLPEDGSKLTAGVVATQALGSTLALTPTGPEAALVAGALVGIGAVTLPRSILGPALDVIGVLGIGALLYGFERDSSCSGLELSNAIILVVVIALAALGGALLAPARARRRNVKPIALLAALEILIFLSQPFGVPLLLQGGVATIVPIVAAGVLGFGGAFVPNLIVGLGAVAIGVTTALVSAGVGTLCSTAPDAVPLSMLAAFLVVFVLGRMLLGRSYRR